MQNDLPAIPREFRAAWIATVDNIDWPTKRDDTVENQRNELKGIVARAKQLHLNALIFQVRPSADALYKSKLEPWSEYLTGQQGRAPSPAWDPLEFMVTECHKNGIELHCWFNPYRAFHPSQKNGFANNHLSKTNPAIVKQYGKFLWMDPGEPAVQKRSLDVMIDVVKRYVADHGLETRKLTPVQQYARLTGRRATSPAAAASAAAPSPAPRRASSPAAAVSSAAAPAPAAVAAAAAPSPAPRRASSRQRRRPAP
jgi:hypothetical protein